MQYAEDEQGEGILMLSWINRPKTLNIWEHILFANFTFSRGVYYSNWYEWENYYYSTVGLCPCVIGNDIAAISVFLRTTLLNVQHLFYRHWHRNIPKHERGSSPSL